MIFSSIGTGPNLETRRGRGAREKLRGPGNRQSDDRYPPAICGSARSTMEGVDDHRHDREVCRSSPTACRKYGRFLMEFDVRYKKNVVRYRLRRRRRSVRSGQSDQQGNQHRSSPFPRRRGARGTGWLDVRRTELRPPGVHPDFDICKVFRWASLDGCRRRGESACHWFDR